MIIMAAPKRRSLFIRVVRIALINTTKPVGSEGMF
jgi:hypothetical protein